MQGPRCVPYRVPGVLHIQGPRCAPCRVPGLPMQGPRCAPCKVPGEPHTGSHVDPTWNPKWSPCRTPCKLQVGPMQVSGILNSQRVPYGPQGISDSIWNHLGSIWRPEADHLGVVGRSPQNLLALLTHMGFLGAGLFGASPAPTPRGSAKLSHAASASAAPAPETQSFHGSCHILHNYNTNSPPNGDSS